MLAIRMQRNGRSHYPVYRIVVQDSERHPLSGRVVAEVGNYNPHTKATTLDKEKVEFYLSHGAQPSTRVARLLKANKIKLPKWVKEAPEKQAKIKNPEKLRKNQPKEEAPAEPAGADESSDATATTEADTSASTDAPEEQSSDTTTEN